MKASDALVEKLKEFEGLRLTAYKAVAGEKWYTVGYGHCGADVRRGATVTEAEAERLLRGDLARFEAGVGELGVRVSQDQFDALVDFAYNVGLGALRKSTLLKYVRRGSTDLLIAREFMKWTRSGGVTLKGLVRRRKWEAELFTGRELVQDEKTLRWMIKKG